MIILLNLGLLAFIFGMAFFWGIQGAFSALLHLVSVVVALAITFALWETVSLWMIGTDTLLSLSAWGVSLLAMFALIMGLLRFLGTYFVTKNVFFSQAVNQVVGGVFGLVAGVYTAGFIFLALSFLPIAGDLGGYDPIRVEQDGRVSWNEESGLWVPVDRWTAGLLRNMSDGPMSGSKSFSTTFGPDFLKEAALFRAATQFDPNLALTVGRSAIELTQIEHYLGFQPYHMPAAGRENLPAHFQLDGGSLMIFRLQWSFSKTSLDTTSRLRVPSTQVRLVIQNDQTNEFRVIPPLGGVRRGIGEEPNVFFVNGYNNHYLFGPVRDGLPLDTDWPFVVPPGYTPVTLRVRNVRFPITTAMIQAINDEGVAPSGLDRVSMDTSTAVADIQFEVTDRLPEVISSNWIPRVETADGAIVSADAVEQITATGQPPRGPARIERVQQRAGAKFVRAEFSFEDARAVTRALGRSTGDRGFWLRFDFNGEISETAPFGFYYRNAANLRRFQFLSGVGTLNSSQEIPMNLLQPEGGHALFLYFNIPEGATAMEIGVGSETLQAVNFEAEVLEGQ